MRKNDMRYPFFFIIDDGGFDYVLPDEKKGKIDMKSYYSILNVARTFNLKIPVCFTMRYLDKENISGVGTPLEYVDELIAFLKENEKYIEIGYHGLVHEHQGHIGEFYCLDTKKSVRKEIQKNYIEKSKAIFEYWGLKFPKLFVPPYHAWEEGVTDKVLSEYGVKYLVSCKKLKFNGHKYNWQQSGYLEFLPRTSIGLNGEDYKMDPQMSRKIKLFPQKTLVEFAKCHIIPQNLFTRLRIGKSLFNCPVHSYMLHIGNFSGQAVEFWTRILDFVTNSEYLYLCKSNEEAAMLYKKLISQGEFSNGQF